MTDDNEFRSIVSGNPFPGTGAATPGSEITKVMIVRDETRARQIREKLVNGILLKANKGSANEADSRVFALVGNVGKGKSHLIQHIVRKANGDDVYTIGDLELPRLDHTYTTYTVTQSPTMQDAAKGDRIYSWLFSRILNIQDLPEYEMGLVHSPSMPDSKRNELLEFVNTIYKQETGHDSVRSLAPMSFEVFFKLLEASLKKALSLSGKKGMVIILDEMEAPTEHLAHKSKHELTIFIESLRNLIDRITVSDLPLYMVFCFTIQSWSTLETSTSISVIQAFMSRLKTNFMLLRVEFTEEEIREFMAYSIRSSVCERDRDDLDRLLKRADLPKTYPFCDEAPGILRRFTRGDPRFVCLHCNKLFEEWLNNKASLTADFTTTHLVKETPVNAELFKSICDMLGERYSYVVRIMKDYTRKLEFDSDELANIILSRCKNYGINSDEGEISDDLKYIAANHSEVLSYNEQKNRYFLGVRFQEIYGFVSPKGNDQGLNPKLQIEYVLKKTRERVRDDPSKELEMLVNGLDFLFSQMGRQHKRLQSSILVDLPEGIKVVYYPVLDVVKGSDVEDAIGLSSKGEVDFITFFGRIPPANKFDARARDLLSSTNHPKSGAYFSSISALKDVCKKVGTQRDYAYLEETFSKLPLSSGVETINLYQGKRIIDMVAMDSEIWLMAAPNYLDGLEDEEQDPMTLYFDSKVKPVLSGMLESKAVTKVKEFKSLGEIDKYLATDAISKSVSRAVRLVGQDKIVVGIDSRMANDCGERNLPNQLQALGFLTEDFSISSIETLRTRNPVVWLMVSYIDKLSPARKGLLKEFSIDAASTKKRVMSTMDVLVNLGFITETDGKLSLAHRRGEAYLEAALSQLKSGLDALKASGCVMNSVELGEIDKLRQEADVSVKLIKRGKPSSGIELIPKLSRARKQIDDILDADRRVAAEILDSMRIENLKEEFAAFSRSYSEVKEGSKSISMSEPELRVYLPGLVVLDPPYSDLSTVTFQRFIAKSDELTARMKREEYGYVAAAKAEYTAAKKDFELGLSRAKSRMMSNARSFVSSSKNIEAKILRFCAQSQIQIDMKSVLMDIDPSSFERLEFAKEFDKIVTHRRKLATTFSGVIDEVGKQLDERLLACSEAIDAERKHLDETVCNLKLSNLLDDAKLAKAKARIAEMEDGLRLKEVKRDFMKLKRDGLQPETFEKVACEDIYNFYSKEIGMVDGSASFPECGMRSAVIELIRKEIDSIPLSMLRGAIKDLFNVIKSGKGVDSKVWAGLENEYGDDLFRYIRELVRLNLIQIR